MARRALAGFGLSVTRRLKDLVTEDTKVKKLLAEAMLNIGALTVVAGKRRKPAGTT